MRLLLLADIDSAHTRKWVTALAAQGLEVGVFSLRKSSSRWFAGLAGVTVFDEQGLDTAAFTGGLAGKLVYLRQLFPLRRAIRSFRPDVLHAHYATSYGLLARLTGFHPFLLSAWGSDVMDFPQRGILHRFLLRPNLRKADVVLATSPTIKRYIQAIVARQVVITPFGINSNEFRKHEVKRLFSPDTLVIGTIKSLETVYRIDAVMDAFADLQQRLPAQPLHLLLVGDGTQRKALEARAHALGITNSTTFVGRVDYSTVPDWHNQIDIFMNISAYESFGVSVLEAMATEVPVIVTDTGGLADLVEQGVEGFRVPLKDTAATTEAMYQLAVDPALRQRMGQHGRAKVVQHYDWQENLQRMLAVYADVMKKNSKR